MCLRFLWNFFYGYFSLNLTIFMEFFESFLFVEMGKLIIGDGILLAFGFKSVC